jgi:hypothetical protein
VDKRVNKKVSEFIEEEMKLVDKIIEDETWLEGERRNESVDEGEIADRVVEVFNKNADSIIHEAKRRSKLD